MEIKFNVNKLILWLLWPITGPIFGVKGLIGLCKEDLETAFCLGWVFSLIIGIIFIVIAGVHGGVFWACLTSWVVGLAVGYCFYRWAEEY